MLASIVLPGIQPAGAAEVPPALPPAASLQGELRTADRQEFQAPARVFHPETWFHFIGGNVATQGITADLEAIAGAGIAGIQLFHGQFGGAWPGVEPQIKCLSGPWDGAVRWVGEECQRLGLRMTMQNCPGWAMAGGPWIAPSNAMRHLVWSRTDITGGTTQPILLPHPEPKREDWADYQEVAVIAFPTPEGDTGQALAPTAIKSNREDLPWTKCLRHQEGGTINLQPGAEPVWVEVTFPETVTLRTVEMPSINSLNHQWNYVPAVRVKIQAVLAEGLRDVADHDLPESNWQDNKPISLACSEVPAKTYRVTLTHGHPMTLGYLDFFTGARKNNWQGEGAWVLRGIDRAKHPTQNRATWVNPAQVADLTGRMDAHGKLDWQVPAGRWTVMRWGHVNSGKRNGPAPPEATGWECDKLSPRGAEAHFAGYIGRLAAGPLAGGLLRGMVLDSWECETQTWTPGMEDHFSSRQHYALRPWLPALAGYVLADPETTTRFLRDWRATINDLVVENFFGRMAALGRARGLAISFETASGDVFPGDILEYYKHAEVPMCEFWQPRSEGFVGSLDFKPVKPCVSAAHLYGKTRVAAEAFTSFDLTWKEHPGYLKPIADLHLAEGVTHLAFHTYTHYPRVDAPPPGTAFGSNIGTPFLRHQTWWPGMPEFTAYLARCGFMLERGRPVADVLWYLGDEQDHKPSQLAPFPAGYHYDYCNPDVLKSRLAVREGRLTTPEGVSFRLLWLPQNQRMLPETLEALLHLVRGGATVLGNPPEGLATLSGGAASEQRFQAAVREIWGTTTASPTPSVRAVGKGQVLSGMSLDDALKKLKIAPDFQGEGLAWNHRQAEGGDWYFVAAPAGEGYRGSVQFRAAGEVEFWDPQSGAITPARIAQRSGTHTSVALDLPPAGSVFVMFKPRTARASSPVASVTRDGQVVVSATLPAQAAPRPVVASASYGDPNDAKRRLDVTARVRQEVAQGRDSVTANNAWAGSDPAPQTRKQLFVTLERNGSQQKLSAGENESLPLGGAILPPPLECSVLGSDGRLVAWEPGKYRLATANGAATTREAKSPRQITLNGPWTLAFPAGWGAPARVQIPQLASWTELDLPAEVRAYSGTATYTREFDAGAMIDTATPAELDLGQVAVMARVTLNGQLVGTVWSPGQRLNISGHLKPGANRLVIEVMNTWHNRLAYDAGLEEASRKTWTISGPPKGAPLIPAGLLGPVKVRLGEAL